MAECYASEIRRLRGSLAVENKLGSTNVASTTFEQWRDELLTVGQIVQDDDHSVNHAEREISFNRYIELLDKINGDEGKEYAMAIIQSVQSVHDYGAYETAQGALLLFGNEIYCAVLVSELPRLISELPDWAGDFLVAVVNSPDSTFAETFNRVLADADELRKEKIIAFIRHQEMDSNWLSHRKGILGAA